MQSTRKYTLSKEELRELEKSNNSELETIRGNLVLLYENDPRFSIPEEKPERSPVFRLLSFCANFLYENEISLSHSNSKAKKSLQSLIADELLGTAKKSFKENLETWRQYAQPIRTQAAPRKNVTTGKESRRSVADEDSRRHAPREEPRRNVAAKVSPEVLAKAFSPKPPTKPQHVEAAQENLSTAFKTNADDVTQPAVETRDLQIEFDEAFARRLTELFERNPEEKNEQKLLNKAFVETYRDFHYEWQRKFGLFRPADKPVTDGMAMLTNKPIASTPKKNG